MSDHAFDPRRVQRWRRDVWRTFEGQGFKPAEIMAALVFAAVAGFGTDVGVLSELTGNSPDYVRKVLKRLRRDRILRGQTLSGAWANSAAGSLAVTLDAGVAAGIFSRFVNEKRSAAQKARSPGTRARGPRRKRAEVVPGAVFTPKVQKSDPLYGLPEWKSR